MAAPLALGAVGLVVLAVAVVLSMRSALPPGNPAAPAATQVTQATPASVPAPQPAPGPAPVASRPLPPAAAPATPPSLAAVTPKPARRAPSFDVVRVEPTGNTVIAGRAAPGAQVTVEANGKKLGSAKANSTGQFVILPNRNLGPGTQKLTLSARTPSGAVTTSKVPVVVAIAPLSAAARTPAPGPLAVLTPPGGPTKVLQAPGAPPAGPGAKIALSSVHYGSRGELRLAGTAPPGMTVRVYVDNNAVGDAKAGPDGRWTLTPSAPVAPGAHKLRLDQLDAGGHVTARVALPFERAEPPATGLAVGQVVVEPGDNLWEIARSTYGHGIRYSVIYAANRGQIRNPNLIYPGQVFTLPGSQGSR